MTVVADDDQSTGPRLKFQFQPQHGMQIQMIRGFIQQQNVGGGEQGSDK
jgi:hypothetical protein